MEELFGNKFSLLLWAGAVLCFIGYSLQQVRTTEQMREIIKRGKIIPSRPPASPDGPLLHMNGHITSCCKFSLPLSTFI